MLANELKQRISEQIALDYCCSPEEAANAKNQFHVFEPREGRRRFQETGETFLKVMSYRNKLLFTGEAGIIDWCRSKYAQADGAWFMEPGTMRELDRKTEEFGYCIHKIHPFFVPGDEILEGVKTSKDCSSYSCGQNSGEPGEGTDAGDCEDRYEIRLYREDEIEVFRGDGRFANAYSFCETAPDVIGVAALRDGEFLGMAGASADSSEFWQIGIDVLPAARGLGIGRILVTRLRDEILKCDKVPYYGTAVSHTLSQNVAIGSGFRAAWSELTTRQIKSRD